MNPFCNGAECMLRLIPFLGMKVRVRVCFGLQRHCVVILNENDLETYNLSEVDEMTLNKEQKKLTPAHLQEFVDQMKELQKHPVFRGRSFVQEGTYFYDDEEEVLVVFNWSS